MLIRQYNNRIDEELNELSSELQREISSSFGPFLESLLQGDYTDRAAIYSHLENLVYDGSDTDWMRDDYFGDWGTKLSEIETEKLIAYSLKKNRTRVGELRHVCREYRELTDGQSDRLSDQNAEIVRLKTQRAIFAILAAVGIGAYGVEKIMDVRGAKPTNENIEPLRQKNEAFSPKSSVIHSPIPSSAARVRHGDPQIIKRVRASFNALIEPETREL